MINIFLFVLTFGTFVTLPRFKMRMRTLTSKKWKNCATGRMTKLRKNLDFLPRLATAFANGFDICLIAKNPNLASGKAGATMMFINNSCTCWLLSNKNDKIESTGYKSHRAHDNSTKNYLQVKIENFKSSDWRLQFPNSVCLRFLSQLSAYLQGCVIWY